MSFLSLRSVRTRLILWNVGILALVLATLGVVFYCRVRVVALGAVDRRMAGYARRYLSERSPGALPLVPGLHGSAGEFEPRLLDLQGHPLGASSFSSSEGAPWDRAGFAEAREGRKVYATITVNGEPARLLSLPLEQQGHIIGVAQFARSLAQVQQDEDQMVGTLLTLIPLGLLIAGAGGAFLTDRALRPVRQITFAASQIEAQNLSGRLAVAGGDEFAHLAETFNGMLGRLERAFRDLGQAYERLESAYQQQQRFTADASHELRTPLAIIKANTSLALTGSRTADQYKEKLQSVDAAADRMNRIVQDLLSLARADAGQRSDLLTPTALAEVLEQAVAAVRELGPAPIRLHLPTQPIRVQGHADSLVRLFGNLLENAVRHTPADGCIQVFADSGDGQAIVQVSDTGDGIAAEHLPRVTERFYRVDAGRARRHGGTGLGLAICQSIVDSHGGEMQIESAAGRGTTVTIRLPLADASENGKAE